MNLIGIDLGIHKVTCAVFDGGTLASVRTYECEEKERVRQLAELGSYVASAAALFQADLFWIEDVLSGNNHKYSLQLAETKRAVMSALGPLALADVRLVNVGTWKKMLLGNGHASKDDVRNYIGVNTPYAPLCGDDQDAYDATCIGLYGLSILARAADLKLSTG